MRKLLALGQTNGVPECASRTRQRMVVQEDLATQHVPLQPILRVAGAGPRTETPSTLAGCDAAMGQSL